MSADAGYPDDIRMYDSDPRSPFYKHDQEELEACDREERFREASDEIEAIANWMGEVWDHAAEDVRDNETLTDDAEALLAAMHVALAPWKARIIAHENKLRAKYGPRSAMKLMGETLPAMTKGVAR
jgi:CRISPR/Cas system CSM-associated protein Csm2 small subunit